MCTKYTTLSSSLLQSTQVVLVDCLHIPTIPNEPLVTRACPEVQPWRYIEHDFDDRDLRFVFLTTYFTEAILKLDIRFRALKLSFWCFETSPLGPQSSLPEEVIGCKLSASLPLSN
jgi:hypothetical protein